MINMITRKEFITLASTMLQGACSNPNTPVAPNDSYGQGQIAQAILSGLGTALNTQGIMVDQTIPQGGAF